MRDEVATMRIRIIGAGMGGLTCALALAKQGFKDIQVYERASDLGFVGAGIQLAPNMARILDRLGVWKDIEKEAVNCAETSIRQGSTDEELAHVELGYVGKIYHYSHMVGHRSSLAGRLFDGCRREPHIQILFGQETSEIDLSSDQPSFASLDRKTGVTKRIDADILLACDGIKSNVRVQMLEILGVDAQVIDTKQAAYRIMLKREDMEKDPELLELIDNDRVTRWIGEKRHIIAYPVSNKTIYNLSTAQPDLNFAEAPTTTYTTKGSKSQMLETFADFCPKVQKMLEMVPEGEVCEWKLRVHQPLPTWTYGRTALVGDACHPTLPHLAQGAAQAIEDAGVIGEVLGRLPDSSADSIDKAFKVYEEVRKTRAETLVEMAAASGRELHLGEGAAKEQRDKAFAALKGSKGAVPDKWADSDVQKLIYGFDCQPVAQAKVEKVFQRYASSDCGVK